MLLPDPRGPFTAQLIAALRDDALPLPAAPATPPADPVTDEELQLALWICYELHYRGFDDVDAEREWDVSVLGLRGELEQVLLTALREAVHVPPDTAPVPDRLRELVDADDGPPLAQFVQRRATRQQFAEFVVHRSIYHVKEADPHSWAIPRLGGRAKAALVEIQADEYGRGELARMHSELFRRTLRGLGLDDGYGRYLDLVPAATLAVNNLMSLFGLHRSLRGATIGHLAAFEMTSSRPNRRYSNALRRLGADENTRMFYDEHVTADALHEQLAAHDLAGGLVADEPQLADDLLFGAAAALYVDSRFAEHLLTRWEARQSSLRGPLPSGPSATASLDTPPRPSLVLQTEDVAHVS
jgi:hypothetical protein